MCHSCARVLNEDLQYDIKNKCKVDIYKNGTETFMTTKKEDSKIQFMEMKFLREILGKTRYIKLETP